MKNSKVMLGVIAGASVGALLGLLFAPEKGSETRRNISNKKDTIADSLKEKFEEFLNVYTRKYENAYSKAKGVINEGKSELNEFSSELNAEINK